MVNHHACRPGAPGGLRHYWLSRGLTETGWQSFLIASASGDSVRRSEATAGRREEDGVNYVWVAGPGYRTNGRDRLRSYLEFSVRVLYPQTTRGLPDPHVIIGSTVHPFAAWAGYRLARRHKVPFIFEIRDLWPETLIEIGDLGRDSIPARSMRRLESLLIKKSTAVISPLSRVGEYLAERYPGTERKFKWISNGFSLEQHPAPVDIEDVAPFTFMYFGAFGVVNELELMVEAFDLAQRDSEVPLQIRFTGGGHQAAAVHREVAARALGNSVQICDPVSAEMVTSEMRKGHALIYAAPDYPALYKYGVSANKIFDYLASGIPSVVAADFPDNPFGRRVDGVRTGILAPPGDPRALADAMLEVVRMSPDERSEIGKAARHMATTEFEYQTLANELASTLEEAVRGAHSGARSTA